MRILSVNVGLPREISWRGESVLTSIFKQPLAGPVAVKTMNIDGDRQADLTVHGGLHKAVYVYPDEHYDFWRNELPLARLEPGAFGENLTAQNVLETDVGPGDTLAIGTALFEVTLPRMPCFKLGIRFDRPDMVKRFWISGRCGFYLAVTREGTIAPGDEIRLTRVQSRSQTIADVFAARGARSRTRP
jgi:MOSC domain-containing protein YiiM